MVYVCMCMCGHLRRSGHLSSGLLGNSVNIAAIRPRSPAPSPPPPAAAAEGLQRLRCSSISSRRCRSPGPPRPRNSAPPGFSSARVIIFKVSTYENPNTTTCEGREGEGMGWESGGTCTHRGGCEGRASLLLRPQRDPQSQVDGGHAADGQLHLVPLARGQDGGAARCVKGGQRGDALPHIPLPLRGGRRAGVGGGGEAEDTAGRIDFRHQILRECILCLCLEGAVQDDQHLGRQATAHDFPGVLPERFRLQRNRSLS